MQGRESRNPDPTIVWLHVYDMSPKNKFTYPFGLGVFHSGIEVYGTEFAFGGHDADSSGIFQISPKIGIPGLALRTSINLGRTTLSKRGIYEVVQKMSRIYIGRSYNILASDFAKELCGKPIPGWVNRLANLGALVPCAVQPDAEWMPDAPTASKNTTGRATDAGN